MKSSKEHETDCREYKFLDPFFNRVLSRVDRADALLKKQQAVFIWLLSNPPDSLFEGR
ncbi:hypothetical protein PLUA15_510061 [Pseudomonas lundensis]|jgi:hypothetical protein|uniref:Uncharacterized protein n=1 Tax=Pseudomonas lundensis TaxID=86185 RepID=A0AAX2HD37_9PSED|nr:hypothetical protein PLUA15_510061 [Pseudomonas lundensis]